MAEPVLKKGSNDPAVRDLQEALKILGFDPGSSMASSGRKPRAPSKSFSRHGKSQSMEWLAE